MNGRRRARFAKQIETIKIEGGSPPGRSRTGPMVNLGGLVKPGAADTVHAAVERKALPKRAKFRRLSRVDAGIASRRHPPRQRQLGGVTLTVFGRKWDHA